MRIRPSTPTSLPASARVSDDAEDKRRRSHAAHGLQQGLKADSIKVRWESGPDLRAHSGD